MHGNVWEWCHDWAPKHPDIKPVDDSLGSETLIFHVLRGGSWVHNGRSIRSAFRLWGESVNRDGDFGFRLSLGHGSGKRSFRQGAGRFSLYSIL
jgi:formylglycine-generating enzyme required for sulfatase activity